MQRSRRLPAIHRPMAPAAPLIVARDRMGARRALQPLFAGRRTSRSCWPACGGGGTPRRTGRTRHGARHAHVAERAVFGARFEILATERTGEGGHHATVPLPWRKPAARYGSVRSTVRCCERASRTRLACVEKDARA